MSRASFSWPVTIHVEAITLTGAAEHTHANSYQLFIAHRSVSFSSRSPRPQGDYLYWLLSHSDVGGTTSLG